MFEAQAYAGGHTNTVRVDTPHETHWVDTGFIVFNDRNYPRFERLLDRLGVRGQPSDMSFAVTDEAGDFEYASTSPNGLFAKRAHLATPWFHRMVADLRALPARGPGAARDRRRRPVARALPGGAPLLARVRRPPDRPPGRGGVVGRPAPDVELPRALPDRVLRQPRDARLPRSPEVADGRRRLAPLRRGAGRAVARPPAPLHAGRARSRRHADHVDGHAARRRGRALRPRRARHALRPGAQAARRPQPRASTSCSARSPTRPTRRCCTPTRRCSRAAAARGRAGTTTCSRSRPASRR